MSNWSLQQNESSIRSLQYLNPDNAVTVLSRPTAPISKSAWTTINESTPELCGFYIGFFIGQNDSVRALFDFAIGSPGNEMPIIQNVATEFFAFRGHGMGNVYFPLQIPSGSRLSARYSIAQNPTTIPGDGMRLTVNGVVPNSFMPIGYSYCDTYGINESTMSGSAVAGAYPEQTNLVEFVASTPRPYRGFMLTGTDYRGIQARLNVWVGSAGNERQIIEQYYVLAVFSGGTHNSPQVLPVNIPSGSRVSISFQSANVYTNHVGIHLFG